MKKQTKNIITHDWIEKELQFYNTADIRSTLVISGSLSLICIPLTALCVWGILSVLNNLLLKIILAITVGAILSAPVWVNLLPLKRFLSERKLLKNGDFDIKTLKVLYKTEKIVQRHTERFLHFEDLKPIMVDYTTYQLADEGDEFYIVYYRTKNNIQLLYSAKMYEYSN